LISGKGALQRAAIASIEAQYMCIPVDVSTQHDEQR
jgi:hypothetical protein